MEVKEVGQDAVDRLYHLWKKTSGRYYHKMSKEEFIHHFFENPSTTNRSFLAKEEDRTLEALILESYNWGSYLYDWIAERDTRILENIFENLESSFRERGREIYLSPIFSDKSI